MTHKSRKGMEMIWIIIWMVIALIVLVVVLAMVTGKIRVFGKTGEELQTGTQARLCSDQGAGCFAGNCPAGSSKLAAPAAGWIDCPAPSNCCKS